MHRRQSISLPLFISFLLAFVVTILPMPEVLRWWQPAWVLCVLIYWTLVSPDSISLPLAWCLGVLLDVFLGTLLGLHALIFSLSIFLLKRSRHGWHRQPTWLRSLAVVGVLMGSYLFQYVLTLFIGGSHQGVSYTLSFVLTAFCWPLVYLLLNLHKR